MERLQVFLRGGASFEIVAEKITVNRSKLDRSLTGIGWGGEKRAWPAFIDLEEVIALVWSEIPDATEESE